VTTPLAAPAVGFPVSIVAGDGPENRDGGAGAGEAARYGGPQE
jgi:hypothetical protein